MGQHVPVTWWGLCFLCIICIACVSQVDDVLHGWVKVATNWVLAGWLAGVSTAACVHDLGWECLGAALRFSCFM
jgi:hypothetical protein